MAENLLYYGDNLDILRRYVKDETVDLVYLDPPFNSDQNYNVLFAEQNGSRSSAQIHAFEDTWCWNQEAAAAYDEITTSTQYPQKVSILLQSFRNFLGDTDMLAYLCMMAPRLVELRRVLETIRLHLSSLRPYGEPLPQAAHGRRIRRRQFSERGGLVLPRSGNSQTGARPKT